MHLKQRITYRNTLYRIQMQVQLINIIKTVMTVYKDMIYYTGIIV